MKHLLEDLFSERHRLTARRRAMAVLHEVCRNRERLNLFADGAPREMPSILLDVDEDAETVVFDIPPEVEGVQWDRSDPVLAVARYEGVFVGFELDDIETVPWNGTQVLRAALPPRVYYLQRRHYFRVPVATGDVSAVVLVRQGAAAINGRCHDISAGGMRVLVNPVAGDFALRAGERLQELRFQLRGTALQTAARIQHVDQPVQLPNGRSLVPLGLEFCDKSFAFDQAVVLYVQQRDRDLLSGRT
ncbi:flagellar brake protein [Thiomonas sp.]|jgi:c-di-GMP-binding flagellar brake protein YcgR|uniref:flagellar brake protein n=1 Tax=Thiomonas sp. TaxID=2047785 RepID=UPI00261EE5C1|nr:flagellar brake protein [Thiomonas sp.]